MRTPAFVAIIWPLENASASDAAHAAAMHLDRIGMANMVDLPGFKLLIRRSHDVPAMQANGDRSLAVVGSLFDRKATFTFTNPAANIELWPSAHAVTQAARLSSTCWGEYAAFCRADDGTVCCFPDPSGALPCHAIESGPVHFVTSSLTPDLAAVLGVTTSINWMVLADVLTDPVCAGHNACLQRVRPLLPGAVHQIAPRRAPHRIWEPAALGTTIADVPSEERLQRVLSAVLRARTYGTHRLAVELSGGLDSSCIIGCLAASDPNLQITAIHHAVPDREGNETDRARGVAERVGANLLIGETQPAAHDLKRFFQIDQDLYPRLGWMDMHQDRATPAMAEEANAGLVITGQGGDAVFFQLVEPAIIGDCLRDQGLFGIWPSVALRMSRRTGMSLWPLLWRQIGRKNAGVGRSRAHGRLFGHLTRDRLNLPTAPHPWLDGTSGLTGAKQRHIEFLCNSQLFHGPSWSGDTGRLSHPLLSQPMIEACFTTAPWQLADGIADRALARRAFARWLPPDFSKADFKAGTAGHYARVLLYHLDWARSVLLDGVLVREQLLDREALDAALARENLMNSEEYQTLSLCISLEAWARAWSRT